MSAHVFLNLLNELRKRDKCEACRVFYLFNKYNSAGALVLDSVYHMTLKILKNRIFGMKMS